MGTGSFCSPQSFCVDDVDDALSCVKVLPTFPRAHKREARLSLYANDEIAVQRQAVSPLCCFAEMWSS